MAQWLGLLAELAKNLWSVRSVYWEACPFLKGHGGAVDWEEGLERAEALAGMYCMKE